jgi:hypothetical protein
VLLRQACPGSTLRSEGHPCEVGPQRVWQHDLTFEDLFTPRRSTMPRTQVSSDSVSLSVQAVGLAFSCTLGDDGRGAAWVPVAGELDLVTAPRLAQVLGQPERCAQRPC